MALIEIEYGALASSDVMNKNFEYLDNKISSVSEEIVANNATINSNLSSLNSNISATQEELNSSIENIQENLTEAELGGLYVKLYVNGTSWYKEYFSDKAKTKRVWLEQGAYIKGGGTITWLRNFSDNNYTVAIGSAQDSVNFSRNVGWTTGLKTPTSIGIYSERQENFIYACGK